MKRIQAACLMQTIHFQLKDEVEHSIAARLVKEEVAHYKTQLERSHIQYQIVDEVVQPDDSIVIRVKKQYNNHKCDEYMQS